MHTKMNLQEMRQKWHGSLKAYLIGFFLCIFLTAASFYVAIEPHLTPLNLVYTIIGLGAMQVLVQLYCFLHIGQEPKPKWQILFFYFMFIVLLVIVIGSIWIMHDLDMRMMQDMISSPTHAGMKHA